jgi:hypothetical protein
VGYWPPGQAANAGAQRRDRCALGLVCPPQYCIIRALFGEKTCKDNVLRGDGMRLPGIGKWLLVVLVFMALAGCEQSRELSEEQRGRLEQRVQERWLALIDRDYDTVWEYFTPTYRESFPKHLYSHKFSYAVKWELTAVRVVNYDASAAVASVAVRVMSEPTKFTSAASRAVGAVPVTIHEQWMFIDGEWWFSTNS